MKKYSFLLLFLGMAFVCAGASRELPFNIEPRIPRKITVGTQPLLVLKPGTFEVLTGANTPAVKLAAQEIADGLSLVFGTKIKPVTKAGGKAVQICVGDRKLAAQLKVDPAAFDRDGFVIKTSGNKILIIGRDLPDCDPKRRVNATGIKGEWATLFGAYEFLERFAGIRYYFPGRLGTYAPSQKEISLPAIDIYDRPDFLQRRFNDYNYGKLPIRRYPEWNGAFNKLRNRVETVYIPNCHGLFFLSYHLRYGKTHPEYFALNANGTRMNGGKTDKDAQICLASSGLKQEIVKDAISFLKNEPPSVRGILDRHGKTAWNKIHTPGMPCFNIMPNDSAYHCRCEACWKHFSKGRQATTNYFWQYFSDICREVKKSGTPGFLTTMAYASYRALPDLTIPDNLLVMLAIRGPWNEFNPPRQAADIALLKSWKEKLGQKTWLWTYPGKYGGRMQGIPHTTPRALASFIKKARPYIFGLYIECESDVVMFNYLIYHVFGKLAWNPDTDVEKLLEEHAVNLYGPAAKPMKEFFNSIEKHWGRIASNVVETEAGPKALYPSELILWGDIYSPKELSRLTALFDEAEKLATGNKLVLERLRFIRQEFLNSILKEAEKFRNANDAVKNFSFPITCFKGKNAPSPRDWQQVKPFYLGGAQGAKTEVATQVKVMYDADNFYFLFDCEEPELDKMQSFKRPFDQKDIWRDSEVEIYLSPAGDRRHCYQVLANASGSVCDLEHISGKSGDRKWNSNAKVTTKLIPGKGWQAEIILPRASMVKASAEGVLANFARHRVLKGKKVSTPYYCWSPFARSFNEISRFGRLLFKAAPSLNLVKNPSFDPAQMKKIWVLGAQSTLDKTCFVTNGSALLLKGGKARPQAYQYLTNLKPDTEYELSYFLKMDKVKGSFNVRFDFGNGSSFSYPAYKVILNGSCPWRVFSHTVKTPKDVNSKRKSYIRFALPSTEGCAWVDEVRIVEKR